MNARLRSGLGDLALRVRTATPRERLMLAALGFVAMLITLSAGIRLTRTSLAAWRETKDSSERAEMLLAGAPSVEAALTAKSARLSGKNISPSDLLASVDTLARELGLNVDAGAPRAEKTGKLVVHRFRVGLRAPDIRKLMDFDDRLRLNDKGIIVERVILEARSDNELSAAYELAACQPAE